MLPETPLLMAFEKKTYRKIRRKVPIKTLPKISPFFFQKRTVSEISSTSTLQTCYTKYWEKSALIKRLYWKDHQKLFVLNNYRKRRKTSISKKDSIKYLVKKHVTHRSCLQYRWNTAIRKQERFKRLIKQSPNKEPTINAVEFFFDKKSVSNFISVSSVQKGWPKNR